MSHLALHGGTIVLAIISQLCTLGSHIFISNGRAPNDTFLSSHWNASHDLSLEMSMDRWADGTWVLIDIWKLTWLFYAMITIFTRNVLGPVSCNPEIHTPGFYLLWTVINIYRMLGVIYGSIYLSSLLPVPSFIILFMSYRNLVINIYRMLGVIYGSIYLNSLLPVPSFIILFMSYRNLDKHRAWLSINSPRELWNIRYLTQNGLALFAWWVLLEFAVDIGFTLNYTGAVKDPLASTIVLVIIVSCALVWCLLQIKLLRRYTKYTFTVYPALILGLGAMFSRSYRIHNFSSNTTLCGCAMILLTILSLIHFICSCRNVDKSSQPLVLTVEGCKTVCQPEGKSSKL